MRQTVLIIYVCLFSMVGFGQRARLDSLLTRLPQTIESAHIPLLHEVVKSSWTVDPNTSLQYARLAIELSKKSGDLKLLSSSYRIMGGLYNYLSLIDSGRYYKTKALEMAIQLGDSALIASSYNNLGVTAQTLGNYVEALSYYYMAYLAVKKDPSFRNTPVILANISEVYFDLQEYDSSRFYAAKALDITQSQPASSRHLLVLNALARAELAKTNFQNARQAYNEILKISDSIGEKRYAAYAYQGLGKLFVQNKSPYPAKLNLNKALHIFEELNDESYISEIYRDLSLLTANTNLDSAFYYTKRSLEIAERLELQDLTLSNYNILIDLFAKEKNMDSLLFYQSRYRTIDASIRKKNSLNSIEGMFAKIRDEEIKSRLANQTLALQRKTVQTNFLIALAIITIIFSGLIFRVYRKQKRLGHYLAIVNKQVTRQNELIDNKNKDLKALNQEKNDIIQIVAHDLKNPLSNIINAVQLIREDSGNNSATALEIIDGSAKRLSGMITEILDVETIEKGLSAIVLNPVNLTEILGKVREDFEGQATNKNITIHTDIDDEVMVMGEPIYLYQVIENLISNAIKFSPSDRNVFVILKSDQHMGRIEIKDEGPGISAKDQKRLFHMYQKLSARPTGDEHSSGIGLAVVKKFVDAMDGKIWCKSSLGVGTSFYVQFNLAEKQMETNSHKELMMN